MKYVLAWLKVAPGKRAEYLELAKPLAAAAREEEGVLLFEYHPSANEADEVIVVQKFASLQAHDQHRATKNFQASLDLVSKFGTEARVEYITSDTAHVEEITVGIQSG